MSKFGGKTLTWKGYVRIKSGHLRDQFEHRVEGARKEGLLFVPPGFEVHHVDGIPWHNDWPNLEVKADVEHRSESGKRRWWGGHRRVTAFDLTEDEYQKLRERGVSVPESILRELEWWKQKHEEVPF